MLAIQDSVHSMQDDMGALNAKMESIKLSIHYVKDEVASLRNRFQELVAELRKITDERHMTRQVCKLVMDESAQKFWGDYFCCDEIVPWNFFSTALCKEYTLTPDQIDYLRRDLDINKDGSVHVREFNIFSKKLGLTAAIQAGCQIAPGPPIPTGGGMDPSLKPYLQLGILMDTTGSMSKWIEQAKCRCLELESSLTNQLQARPFQVATLPLVSAASYCLKSHRSSSFVALQVAFIGYKDFDEPGHLVSCPFGSMADVKRLLAPLEASGGADIAEDVGGGLQQADDLAWSAPLKVLVHFLDAPPHGEKHHEMHMEEAFFDDPDGYDRCHEASSCFEVYRERIVDLGAVARSLARKRVRYTMVRCGRPKDHARTQRVADVCRRQYEEEAEEARRTGRKGQMPVFRDLTLDQNQAIEYLSLVLASAQE
jgi:hypothetical protein